MAELQHMPPIIIPATELIPYGRAWSINNNLSRTPPFSSMDLTHVFDQKIGEALAVMLGGVPVVALTQNNANPRLIPDTPDCVEVGPCRVIGGIRPQNFDVGYRPDGIRIAFDSKTLNDTSSANKNYQNMVNDLGTEASTVHTRFPYAIVAFLIAIPSPCTSSRNRASLTSMLLRLTGRNSPVDVQHKAEAIAFVLWDPATGEIDQTWPELDSPLRIEQFSRQIESAYVSRYAGMPPHQPQHH